MTDEAVGAPPGIGVPTRGAWSGAVIVFVGNVIARALGFAFPLALARAVGRDDFALVYFFISTGFFVGELVLAGFPTSLTRFLAAPGAMPRGAWLVSAIAAGLPLLLASILAGIAFAGAADADPRLLAVMIVGLTIDAYYFAGLRGLSRFTLLVAYRIGANLAQILLLLGAWWLGLATVPVVVAIYAFTYLVPILAIEVAVGPVRALVGPAARVSRELLGPLTRFAIPALISGTAYAAIMGLDVYWVRVLAPAELADYGAARALAMPMSLVPFAIGVVLLPRVAATEPAGQVRLLRQALAATTVAAAAAVAGYVLLGAWVVGVVYPDGYEAAADLLPLLATAMGVMGVYSVLSQWWMGRGRPGPAAASLVVGAVVAAVAHVVLDPRLGAVGAAWSMLIGGAVAVAILGGVTAATTGASSPEADDLVG